MEKIKQAYPPGDFGIWIIIYIELITFGALFLGYAFSRRLDVELFNQSQLLLEQYLGFINTLILISSSFFLVKAIELIKKSTDIKKNIYASRWISFAMLFGLLFLILKAFEFKIKYEQGIDLSTNTFFMFYYLLTVFHFMHVILGIIILYNLYKNTKQGIYTNNNLMGLETGVSYWHMVDLLWIILFPLIYIMR